jgi:hypothetical protein
MIAEDEMSATSNDPETKKKNRRARKKKKNPNGRRRLWKKVGLVGLGSPSMRPLSV